MSYPIASCALIAAGPHGDHSGSGRPGGGRQLGGGRRFGGGGHGGHGLRAGRILVAADLQLIILALLAEKPRHGYEVIKAVGERSDGFYTPSPGMVYPALSYLVDVGYARVEALDAKKLYTLTDEGRGHVSLQHERIEALFSELARVGKRMASAKRAYDAERGDEPDGRSAADALAAARREFKSALFDVLDAPPEEQRRATEILQRATAELRGKK